MNTVTLERKTLDLSAYRRGAVESDYSVLLDEPSIIRDQFGLVAVYCDLGTDAADLREAVAQVKILRGHRTMGLATKTRGFGLKTRHAIRGDYCNPSSAARDFPGEHDVICRYATILTDLYRQHCGATFSAHKSESQSLIVPEFRLPGGIFTSGNLNKNNKIVYHYDKGNLPGVFSGMIVLKKGCEGGFLSLPELDCGVTLRDATVFLFDGQSTLHGVTPFKLARGGYRYTLVYFTFQQAWKCLPPAQELDRIKKAQTVRERKMVGESVEDHLARMKKLSVLEARKR